MFTYRKMMLMLISLSLMLVACQKQGAGGSRVKSYAQDGLLGISDVNPNMPMSPTYRTYQRDNDVMEQTIKQVPNVTGSSITTNGSNATVRIDVPKGLTDQEVALVERDALEKLSKAMPRYKVKVTVSRK
jgi:hypothetical protein